MKAYLDSTGARHIVLSDGKDVKVPKEEDEVDSMEAVIADDKQSAGWLVNYKNSSTSYSIPLMLVIYRPTSPLLHFARMMIVAWHFVDGGKRVAFSTNTVHGDYAPHYELRDIRTGRLIAELDGHSTRNLPNGLMG